MCNETRSTNRPRICNCFRKLNIFPGETRDDEYRERFLMDKFEQLISRPSIDQYRFSFNPIRLVKKNIKSFRFQLFLFFYRQGRGLL